MPDTDDDTLASWGGGQDLSAWEALMWRTDGDHRTRSTGVMVELLDQEPDWDRLVAAHDRFTQRVPRLRERVVEPPLPLVAPAWSPDPHFDLDYHLQRVRLPGDGSMAELHALAAQFAARPLDPERPAWEALLVLGVTGGQAAYLFKPHHSLSDGIGLLQLLDLAHAHGREPGPADDGPMPKPRRQESPEGLLVNRLAAKVVNAPADAVRETLYAAGRFAGDPVGTTTDAVKFAMSLRRVLMPPDTPHSPALSRERIRLSAGHLRCALRRPESGGKGRWRFGQRCIPGRSARRGPALPREALPHSRFHAGGDTGQPSHRCRPDGRQQVRRRTVRGAGR